MLCIVIFEIYNGVPFVSDGGGGISKGNGCFGHLTALLDDPMTSSLSPSANFQPASVIFSSSQERVLNWSGPYFT